MIDYPLVSLQWWFITLEWQHEFKEQHLCIL